ncbi:YceH family protein [Pirellulaceae bacterium SH449]
MENDSESPETDMKPEESTSTIPSTPAVAPEWKPLNANQRRVLGTLMEKSKTTPDAYPMSYTGLATGCNQKSNRDPISNLSVEQVEAIVDELRAVGAAAIIQGSGRVTKVRHYAYNWLGLSKVEAAVMTELLLRGAQTMGELRTRASRMEPISDLSVLQEIFDGLKQRGLVVALTPPGRGQIVSHNLYPEWELEKLKGSKWDSPTNSESSSDAGPGSHASKVDGGELAALRTEVNDLKETVRTLSERLERLEKDLGVS